MVLPPASRAADMWAQLWGRVHVSVTLPQGISIRGAPMPGLQRSERLAFILLLLGSTVLYHSPSSDWSRHSIINFPNHCSDLAPPEKRRSDINFWPLQWLHKHSTPRCSARRVGLGSEIPWLENWTNFGIQRNLNTASLKFWPNLLKFDRFDFSKVGTVHTKNSVLFIHNPVNKIKFGLNFFTVVSLNTIGKW
jgi:hypothetical protein